MNVFVLYFIGPSTDGGWFGKFLGVYSSQKQALRAVERFQGRPAYRHYPKGFEVEGVQVDEDYESPLGPPPPPLLAPSSN
jgi:hypothetical protein